MRFWPFPRKEEPPAPEDDPDELITITATPYAGLVCQMLAAGASHQTVVMVLQLLESEQARIRAQISAAMSTEHRADSTTDKTDTVSTTMSTTVSTRKRPATRRAKWRELKRNQRAKLRLVSTSKSTTG